MGVDSPQVSMITTRLRTVAFLIACALLGYGILILLHRMQITAAGNIEEQLTAARDIMVDAGRGLLWVLAGTLCALLVVLWNSSALNKDWLDVLTFAFKGFGALVLLLLMILFLRQYQVQKVIETIRESEAKTERDKREKEEAHEKAAEQARERNRERVTTLLTRLAQHSNDPTPRKITIAVAGSQLRDKEVMSLSLAEALHATALYDPDDSVRSCARDILYPIPQSVIVDWPSVLHGDFAEFVTRLLEEHPELYKTARYFRYAKVVQSEGNDPDLSTRLEAVESKTSKKLVADASAASSLKENPSVAATSPTPSAAFTPSSNATAPTPAPNNPDATARGIIMAAVDSNPATQKKALDLLAQASQTRVEKIISSLPPEAKSDLPPRLYVHVAEQQDLNKLAGIVKKLQQALVDSKRPMIILKPIWVGEIPRLPKAPHQTEVRYYQSEQTNMAQTIKGTLNSAGIKDVRLYQAKPTEPRDLQGQLEVWFAKDALKTSK